MPTRGDAGMKLNALKEVFPAPADSDVAALGVNNAPELSEY